MVLFVYHAEKTKNLLFNGAKAVMGKIWTGDEKSAAPQPSEQADSPVCSKTLLRGQTLIGHDGRLTRSGAAKGELEQLIHLFYEKHMLKIFVKLAKFKVLCWV